MVLRDLDNSTFLCFEVRMSRFLTRFLARVLSRVSAREKTMNTVYSATRP